MDKQFLVALIRFAILVASFGFLAYVGAMIFIIAPGEETLNQDAFWFILAVGLVLLALLLQRRKSRIGQYLESF